MFLTNITSSVFNLITLSFIAIWISYRILEIKTHDDQPLRKSGFYNWFTGLSIFAMLAILSYVFAPRKVFTNASHHVIEHLGFSFENQLSLANESDPDKAIWDDKNGDLSVNFDHSSQNFMLITHDFYEPIYVRKGKVYQLSNPITSVPIEKELSIMIGDTLGLSFYIGQKEGLYTIKAHLNEQTFGPYVSTIRQPLRTGYSLTSFLNNLPSDAPNLSDLILALNGSLLLREKDNKQLENNPLLFFPSMILAKSNPSIKIDGKDIDLTQQNNFKIPLTAQTPFYLGLWNTQTKTYKSVYQHGTCQLLTTFPNKKYLKKSDAEKEILFLTSSSDEIANNNLVSGFYYPIMNNESNQNHFSANLSYQSGPTIEKMIFKLINLDQNDLDNAKKQNTYMAGDTMSIRTRGVISDTVSTQWLFKIKDLKADNPLQFWHLLALNILLLMMVFISIYLTPYTEQSKTEYIIYILIITLMTIRSVLIWRASTFVPTDDISENIYKQLTIGMFNNFRNGVMAVVIFFLIVWFWKLFGNRIFKNSPIRTVFKTNSYLDYACFGLYAIGFGIKILGISQLERIASIYLPIFVYILIEFWFLYKLHQQQQSSVLNKRYRFFAIINWLICFAYLALSDAGFSIVFFIATLIYWLLQLLTFPTYLHQADTTTFFGRLRHWRFIVPIITLVLFIVFAPYLVSFVFLKTTLFLIGLAGILLSLAFYLFFQKNYFSRITKSSLSISLIVFAAFVCLFKDKISEKIQEKNYVRYRAEILFKTPDEIIQEEEFKFNLGNDSKLLRAAQNQWFINYYYENGVIGWVNPFIQLVKGNYFQILPSFQKGSPYLTQISDLVSVRYVMGEHSQLIILNLLILMILLILSAINKDIPFNFYSKLRVLLLCLLFTVGFFIWMAATNRIIFLGQDFPLLSLNSILTLLFTFSILFFVILFGQQARRQVYIGSFNLFGQKLFHRLIRFVLFVGVILIALRKHDFSEKSFNLDATIESLRDDFTALNETFADFQQQNTNRYQSLQPLLADFEKYQSLEKPYLFKTEFSKSAYEAYMKTLKKHNNPQNLIHIRRGNDGIYEFAINKLYYNVTSPTLINDTWKGHLISSDNLTSYALVNRENQLQLMIDHDKTNSGLEKALNSKGLYDFADNENIRITLIPATWTLDSLPKILISSTSGQQAINRSKFTIKNEGEIIYSDTNPFTIVLKKGDIVQFIPVGNSKPTTLQYQNQSKQYLAKNVWLNGKNQFFYPLKHKFIWTYHFANLVKTKFDGDKKHQNQDLALSIDPVLTEQIYDKVEAYFKKSLWRPAEENDRAFNLVVLDSRGKIKALSDFQKGLSVKFDPNRMAEYRDNLDKIYLNSDTDNERLFFGNRCLMRSDNGPASTFKPILYAAVTSQFNFDWPNLAFGGLSVDAPIVYQSGSDSYVVKRFGNRPVKFNLIAPNFPAHDNIKYISQSTNSYNSMVAFLGSLSKNQMNNLRKYIRGFGNDSTFLKRGLSGNVAENFPDFKISNQSYRINHFPAWNNEHSLIAKGLWENFNFPVRAEQIKGREGQNIQNLAYDLDSVDFAQSKSSFKLWSFPEPSHLYLIDRNNLHNAIVQVASGADPINTTPLKMAEMAGTLFSFNKSFRATVLANSQTKFTPLGVDNSWGGNDQLSSFYSNNLFIGMNEAFTQGTAKNLVGTFLSASYPNYHFYAKTGTISGNRSKGKRDKHLMLIISKNPLHHRALDVNEMRKNRFYVLYISFYKQSNNSNWHTAIPLVQNIVKTVIESSNFQAFMNHE